MKHFLILCSIILLAACSGNKEEKSDLSNKKAELAKITKERDALTAKISSLEDEISKIDRY